MNKKAVTYLIIISVVLLCLFVYFFDDISNNYFSKDNPKGELIKVFLTFIAGIIALLVWHSSYRRAKATEKQLKIMEKGNIESRFNNAVGHLGNENPTIVLGGIHVLHQIAVENENYTRVIHNLFCNYLRENSTKLYPEKRSYSDSGRLVQVSAVEGTPKCPIIIQTLIDYLFKEYNNKDSVYNGFDSDLSYSTIKNCDFEKAKIRRVNFNNCIFENCHFFETILLECRFSESILTKCHFSYSTLTECHFSYSTLTECHFCKTLTRCYFYQSILTDCVFSGILTECNFIAYIRGLKSAELINCEFKTAELIDTVLPYPDKNKVKKSVFTKMT